MTAVELIYDQDCPNVNLTRTQLAEALTESGLPVRWAEWDRADTAAPPYVRSYGSPTVLINGRDVAGTAPSEDMTCCRLYTDALGGHTGAPPVEMIITALKHPDNPMGTGNKNRQRGWWSVLAVVPGIGASLLPGGICPACWPAYAGLLSAVGLGFMLKTPYLLSLTVVFFFIALAALAYRAGRRRGYGPFALGLAGSILILAGKFALASDLALYAGIAILVGASVWNTWPKTSPSTVVKKPKERSDEQNRSSIRARGLANALSLFTSTATLLCCALPAAVATIVGGSAVIAMTSALPWLIPLSRHKDWIFLAAVTMLVLHGVLLFRPKGRIACSLTGGTGCAIAGRVTRVMFWVSISIVIIGAFFAYALVPILRFFEG